MQDLIPTNLTEIAIYILLFSAYFMVMEVVFFAVANRVSRRGVVSRRLSMGSARANLADGRLGVRLSQLSGIPARNDARRTGPLSSVGRLVYQSGYQLRLWHPLLAIVVVAGVGVGFYVLTRSVVAASFVVALLVLTGPIAVLLILRSSRLRKFEGQLPDLLDTMVRSIRAGHPIPASIRMVVQEFPEPAGKEFQQVADELTYGMDLESAMRSMSSRVQLHDLHLVTSAISIQSKSGGNLAEILSNLAQVVRDRLRMRLKIRALSAEGRLSAIVLSLLPFLLYGLLSITAPAFYGDIWQYNIVYPIFFAAGVWMAIGNFIMWRLVSFEI